MNIIRRNIPNAVTCLNLLSGIMAIIFAFNPYSHYAGLDGWKWSVIAIGAAALFDFLDGFCARMLHAYSDMGKELDSLCDLVSFGVAPALIIFNLLAEPGTLPHYSAWFMLLTPLAGALRLAKFNIDSRQSSSFIGLPIPANAIFWVGYASLIANGVVHSPAIIIPLAIIMAWLMISPLKLFSLKAKSLKWKENRLRFILIAASAILICWLGLYALCLIIPLYILLAVCGAAAGIKE